MLVKAYKNSQLFISADNRVDPMFTQPSSLHKHTTLLLFAGVGAMNRMLGNIEGGVVVVAAATVVIVFVVYLKYSHIV